MIIHALQTGTPFVYEIFRKGYCIRGNCTSDKCFIFKWSTICKACIIIRWGKPRQLDLPSIPYSLVPLVYPLSSEILESWLFFWNPIIFLIFNFFLLLKPSNLKSLKKSDKNVLSTLSTMYIPKGLNFNLKCWLSYRAKSNNPLFQLLRLQWLLDPFIKLSLQDMITTGSTWN